MPFFNIKLRWGRAEAIEKLSQWLDDIVKLPLVLEPFDKQIFAAIANGVIDPLRSLLARFIVIKFADEE